MRSSYHPFMAHLQQALNTLAEYDFSCSRAELRDWAARDGLQSPLDWGADQGEPLSREEILHAANYQFDVWAAGYNWLQSNRDSGAAIKALIEQVILPYYNAGKTVALADVPDGEGNTDCRIRRPRPGRDLARGVIVVTHSMGGLVSRALTEIHACEAVLGVSHGVQPATYKRMRAGVEGAEQLLLGRNAADVVAILSQAPGGLELLPTADYNGGKPWLFLRDTAGGDPLLALPTRDGDPYSQIYASPAWYGLVPEANTGLLQAATASGRDEHEKADRASPRKPLEEVVEAVQAFHTAIQGRYKTPTYAHYGAQGRRAAEGPRGGILGTGLLAAGHLFTWGEVAWQGTGLKGLAPHTLRIAEDDGNGILTTTGGIRLSIANPDCPGDGTVPVYSGEAPGLAGIAGSFAHGQGKPGACNTESCYDHQGSYGDKHRRSLFATMYAIVKIAQKARWHEQ